MSHDNNEETNKITKFVNKAYNKDLVTFKNFLEQT